MNNSKNKYNSHNYILNILLYKQKKKLYLIQDETEKEFLELSRKKTESMANMHTWICSCMDGHYHYTVILCS